MKFSRRQGIGTYLFAHVFVLLGLFLVVDALLGNPANIHSGDDGDRAHPVLIILFGVIFGGTGIGMAWFCKKLTIEGTTIILTRSVLGISLARERVPLSAGDSFKVAYDGEGETTGYHVLLSQAPGQRKLLFFHHEAEADQVCAQLTSCLPSVSTEPVR